MTDGLLEIVDDDYDYQFSKEIVKRGTCLSDITVGISPETESSSDRRYMKVQHLGKELKDLTRGKQAAKSRTTDLLAYQNPNCQGLEYMSVRL